MKGKEKYIRNMKIGTIIAYKKGGETRSGKILVINGKKNTYTVEEFYSGEEEKVELDDIIWVKTRRWPKEIWNELRGEQDA